MGGKLPQNIGLSASDKANLQTKRKRAVFFSFYQLLVSVSIALTTIALSLAVARATL